MDQKNLLASHQFYCRGYVEQNGQIEQVLSGYEEVDHKVNVLRDVYRDGTSRLVCPCLEDGSCMALNMRAAGIFYQNRHYDVVECPYVDASSDTS